MISKFPKYAKVIKGEWIDDGYGGVWCNEIWYPA